MIETINLKKSKKKVTSVVCVFTRAPYTIVTKVALMKGNITEIMLPYAVSKGQQRQMHL
jgi:hypothetical protein